MALNPLKSKVELLILSQFATILLVLSGLPTATVVLKANSKVNLLNDETYRYATIIVSSFGYIE